MQPPLLMAPAPRKGFMTMKETGREGEGGREGRGRKGGNGVGGKKGGRETGSNNRVYVLTKFPLAFGNFQIESLCV